MLAHPLWRDDRRYLYAARVEGFDVLSADSASAMTGRDSGSRLGFRYLGADRLLTALCGLAQLHPKHPRWRMLDLTWSKQQSYPAIDTGCGGSPRSSSGTTPATCSG
jgi:hypothetical protein